MEYKVGKKQNFNEVRVENMAKRGAPNINKYEYVGIPFGYMFIYIVNGES